MRLRRKPNEFDQQHQALISKAFAVHSGRTPADAGPEKPSTEPRQEDPRSAASEQREDELLTTVEHALQGGLEAVTELRQIQEEEENQTPEAEMANQDKEKPMSSDTGSSSAQGWP